MRQNPYTPQVKSLATVATAIAIALSVVACSGDRAGDPSAAYSAAIAHIDSMAAHEMQDKHLPGLAIAIVDDQRIVWSKGYGTERTNPDRAISSSTVFRVGSVSKLFTDIAIMQLVERGEVTLDTPVSEYIGDVLPASSDATGITLRRLMAHRSGLVREPPVGHYSDSSDVTLAATVESLKGTSLVYPSGTHTKYSNAAIAVVGYTIEQTQKQPFASYIKSAVLNPMGLTSSAFAPDSSSNAHLADAVMWSYDGREFPAPTFQLGMSPAGSMYTTVDDLGKFMSVLFNGGRGANGHVISTALLDTMWTPQFLNEGVGSRGYGLGFALSELDGHRRVAHGGAIYGFSTTLSALPDDKLGVVVVATVDGANAVADAIADAALRSMLAVRAGTPMPPTEQSDSVGLARARALAGRYGMGERAMDLIEQSGRLYMFPVRGGFRAEVKSMGDSLLVVDDRLAHGAKIRLTASGIVSGADTLAKVAATKPAASPDRWKGVVGEYGWDYNTLFLLERDGQLNALVEWFYQYPLTEVSTDVYAFPKWGLYDGERVEIKRNASGRVTDAVMAGIDFSRRAVGTEDGSQFTITPVKPVAELRAAALAASPPSEPGPFLPSDLVALTSIDPSIQLDVRYATTNNFMGTVFYSSARAFMQRPAADAVANANRALKPLGYGLLVHDAYRPWYVTKMFWDGTPPEHHTFVADPSQGSRHNRGAAVDLTLYDLKTGRPVQMTGGYDEFSNRSYPYYPGGTDLQRWHRALLRHAMEDVGFTVYEAEWWHFDFNDWRKYPIGTATYEEIEAAAAARNAGTRGAGK